MEPSILRRLPPPRLPAPKAQNIVYSWINFFSNVPRVIKKYMLSLTRAIIYLHGVSGFRSRPAPGSGSETLYSRKLSYEFFTLAFWLHNNICLFPTWEYKFKMLFCTQKPSVKYSYLSFLVDKFVLSFLCRSLSSIYNIQYTYLSIS